MVAVVMEHTTTTVQARGPAEAPARPVTACDVVQQEETQHPKGNTTEPAFPRQGYIYLHFPPFPLADLLHFPRPLLVQSWDS